MAENLETETLFTGARALFIFEGTPLLDLMNVSGSIAVDKRPYKPTGSFLVKEHVTTGKRVGLRASSAKRIGTDILESLRLMPKNINEAVNKRVGQVVIQDAVTLKPLFVYTKVEIATYDWSYGADDIVMENITFVAIDARTENSVAVA